MEEFKAFIVVAPGMHCHESATGVQVFPHPETPPTSLPTPTPLGCPRAPALSALLHHNIVKKLSSN